MSILRTSISLREVGANVRLRTQLYVYPIKSLRPTTVTEGELTPLGFRYDRCFMLLKVEPGENGAEPTLKNMHVPDFPAMALFQTNIEISESKEVNSKVIVTYHPPTQGDLNQSRTPRDTRRLEIPLHPNEKQLKPLKITMHQSPTTGFDMGAEYNDWFSECFGYRVVLAFLGPNTRGVLGTLAPAKRNKERWWSVWRQELTLPGNKLVDRWIQLICLASLFLNVVGWSLRRFQSGLPGPQALGLTSVVLGGLWAAVNWYAQRKHEARITFADCAPYLVISETSVDNVSARLAGDEEMDRTKFRPNIVVSGAERAFEEDFWAELAIGTTSKAQLLLTANCVRCQSLNVDFETGKMGTGEAGSVLKKLMKDRRVDKGARFSPVFGRYSFLGKMAIGQKIRVGDEVEVVARAKEHSVIGE
ncbi:Molybdenum cofactor sulfurase C-terminal [Penicillium macrosclerotiorum]|uniref:Molybdenum cofactor sulfurase C-terminal n=1 Tax=Penicillium macrosclerotiorum TaxID=303699 RepID=UPI002549728F|nr:Molybdenum cofactor sulfurase C-terminal [Penicillium macrosclerotiorum]KAJ5668866.1 Molybdenum cofactor sulfurase C-terminal [Penicillium macrosclerotiorum]